MINEIDLYVKHPSDWLQSEYIELKLNCLYHTSGTATSVKIIDWKTIDFNEWITEELIYESLYKRIYPHLKPKTNEQFN